CALADFPTCKCPASLFGRKSPHLSVSATQNRLGCGQPLRPHSVPMARCRQRRIVPVAEQLSRLAPGKRIIEERISSKGRIGCHLVASPTLAEKLYLCRPELQGGLDRLYRIWRGLVRLADRSYQVS